LSEGKLTLYTGGYDAFERRRAEMTRLQSATRAKQEAERAHLQASSIASRPRPARPRRRSRGSSAWPSWSRSQR